MCNLVDKTDVEFFFSEIGAQPYHRALYRLCKAFDPACVVEVGTYAGIGALCLSLVGKPVVTIDISHQKLRETMQEKGEFLKGYGLDGLHVMTKNFQLITPEIGGERTFLFYDIHDHELEDRDRSSKHLIDVWIPTLQDALVAVHDVAEGIRGKRSKTPPSYSEATLWDGREFWGFGECGYIIDLLNEHRATLVQVEGTASLVYFNVKEGVPV
jgi:hypothetical protein